MPYLQNEEFSTSSQYFTKHGQARLYSLLAEPFDEMMRHLSLEFLCLLPLGKFPFWLIDRCQEKSLQAGWNFLTLFCIYFYEINLLWQVILVSIYGMCGSPLLSCPKWFLPPGIKQSV